MRPRIPRIIQVVEKMGTYGQCSCGGQVLFYSDSGVKCARCSKLFGVWYQRRRRRSHDHSGALRSAAKTGDSLLE